MTLIDRAKAGNEDAVQSVLESYRPLLVSLARRFQGAGTEDLCQAGYIGLMEALRRYDAQQGVQFITYAVPWVLGEMRKAMKKAVDGTGAIEKRRQIDRRQASLCTELGREPTIGELARGCRMTEEEIIRTMEVARPAKSLEDEENPPVGEALKSPESIDLETLSVRMALDKLKKEEKQLVILRFFRDKTQKEAAQILGKSQAQVSRTERRALDQLREMLS